MTSPTTSKGPKARYRASLWAAVKSWDTYVSAVLGLVVGVWSAVAPVLSGGRGALGAALSACVFLAGVASNLGAALSQETRSHFWGQVIRVFDRQQRSLRLPYEIITYVALAGAAWNLVATVAIPDLPSGIAAIAYGGSAWLTSWAFLGVFDLYRLSQRHESMRAEAQALKEEFKRSGANAGRSSG